MLEDSPEDAILIERELRKGKIPFISKRVDTKNNFHNELFNFKPDIILADYKLPNFNGSEAIQHVKTYTPEIPIIMVTGTLGEEAAAGCIKEGSADYVLKDNLIRLSTAVRNALKLKKEREEKLQAEQALRKSEEKYRTLTENLKVGIFRTTPDPKGTYIEANQSMVTMFGYKSKEEFLSSYPIDLYQNHEVRAKTRDKLSKIGSIKNEELLFKKKDGTALICSVTAVAVKDEKGNIIYYDGVVEDITERKQMEQMLLQSEKLASIGTIAAGIAHEINNPLGYIYSNLKTLQDYQEKLQKFCDTISSCLEEYSSSDNYDKKDILNKFKLCKSESAIEYLIGEIKNAVDESVEGAEKVKKIVQELRDFSRQEKPEIKPANINEIIETTVNILWNELKYKAEVIKEYNDIPDLECDRQKLEQVFMNIIINAIQAIEMNGKITIKTFIANNNIVAQMSDTGKGIERKNINRIFDAFFTTKEPGKGTGLGLSIASKIIQQHNGIIEVESEVGKGSTFTIKLPIRRGNV